MGARQNPAVSSPGSIRASQLACLRQGPVCRAVAEVAAVPALPGWVTGLSPGGCPEDHLGSALSDLLRSSDRSSSFRLFIALVCAAAITPPVRCHSGFP